MAFNAQGGFKCLSVHSLKAIWGVSQNLLIPLLNRVIVDFVQRSALARSTALSLMLRHVSVTAIR